MPATLESPYGHGASHSQRSGQAVNVASQGGPLVVANNDAKASNLSLGALDPYAVKAGSSGNHANVRVLTVPQIYSHMEVYLAWTGTAPTAHKAIAVGLPAPPHKGKRVLPFDIEATFTDRANLWIPLVVVSGSTAFPPGTGEIDIVEMQDGGVDIDDGSTWVLTGPNVCYLAGVREVMILNTVAAATATKALVLARFVG